MSTKKTESLSSEDISTARTGRRSAMLMIGGAVVTAVTAQACATGCTDSDTGSGADPANSGRRCSGSGGCSDRDPSDPVGRGRFC